MFGGVLYLLILIFVQKLNKCVSFTYLMHVFEFTCFRSSHKKLLYQMLFDNEGDVLLYAEFSFSKTAVHLQPKDKDKLPLKYFIRRII